MSKSYDEFMSDYKLQHAACPQCGSTDHTTTLAGYIFDEEHPETYQDLNQCTCEKCGHTHTAHEMVKKVNRVSYSQYSLFSSCPHQYKLHYIDKLSKSTSNIFTLFGSSIHLVVQSYLTTMYTVSKVAADKLDTSIMLFEALRDNFIKEREQGYLPCTQTELEDFYGDGVRILDWFKKHINKFYSRAGFELVGVEISLEAPVKNGVVFVGFIDIAIRDLSDGTIIIIDLKTSTYGWNQYQKADKYKNSQLLLYKKFYADLFQIPLTKIRVEYQIMRRKLPEDSMFPIPYMSRHVPANGSPSVNRTYSEFMEFIDRVFDENGDYRLDVEYPKEPGPNKKNCKWCEFKLREMCDGKN